jgi:hypothetical protein
MDLAASGLNGCGGSSIDRPIVPARIEFRKTRAVTAAQPGFFIPGSPSLT